MRSDHRSRTLQSAQCATQRTSARNNVTIKKRKKDKKKGKQASAENRHVDSNRPTASHHTPATATIAKQTL